jgi:hypothetical protein
MSLLQVCNKIGTIIRQTGFLAIFGLIVTILIPSDIMFSVITKFASFWNEEITIAELFCDSFEYAKLKVFSIYLMNFACAAFFTRNRPPPPFAYPMNGRLRFAGVINDWYPFTPRLFVLFDKIERT